MTLIVTLTVITVEKMTLTKVTLMMMMMGITMEKAMLSKSEDTDRGTTCKAKETRGSEEECVSCLVQISSTVLMDVYLKYTFFDTNSLLARHFFPIFTSGKVSDIFVYRDN